MRSLADRALSVSLPRMRVPARRALAIFIRRDSLSGGVDSGIFLLSRREQGGRTWPGGGVLIADTPRDIWVRVQWLSSQLVPARNACILVLSWLQYWG